MLCQDVYACVAQIHTNQPPAAKAPVLAALMRPKLPGAPCSQSRLLAAWPTALTELTAAKISGFTLDILCPE